jgi:ligand-binding sensor domain-containing protein
MKKFKNLNIYFITFAVILLITYTNLYSQDFWYPLPGPYGGNILAIAENSSGTLFVGTEGGGVFRSFDDGDSWESANNGIPTGAGNTAFKVYSIWSHTNGNVFIGTSKEG